MQFEYTPYVIPVILASVFALWIAAYGWQRRTARNTLLLTALSLALTEWLSFYALQISGANLATKVLFGEIKYIGVATTPLAWLFFAIQFADQGDLKPKRRLLFLISLIPAITSLLSVTTRWHGLFWSNPALVVADGFSDFSVDYGPWYWVHVSYSYLLILAGTVIVFRSVRQRQGLHRNQAIALIASVLAPWFGNILYFSGYNPIPYLDLTPFAFTITVALLTWAIIGFRLVELAPIARTLIIEEMKDGMLVIDALGRVVDINPAAGQMIRTTAPKAIGKPLATLLDQWPNLLERYRYVMDTLEEFPIGDGRWIELRISPLHDRRGQFLGRVIVLRDTTTRKETENALSAALEQAQEANRLKSQLLARVSHELRTPLGGILGFAELLQLNTFGDLNDKQKEATDEIIGSANELTGIIEQLISQAQLEAESLTLQNSWFAIKNILRRVDERFSAAANAKGLRFHIDLAPDFPEPIYGDERRVEQILSNLVGNAVKFTEQGQVDVRVCRVETGMWLMEVADTGPGITHEAQAYIFEPFRQVSNAITRDNRGTGLGLSITRQLVNLMKGEIRLESEPVQGSTFTVLLPLVEG
jgi:PAS domain S-box-containing protein